MAGSKNVALVEDDQMIRDLYRSALVNADYKVEIAGSSKELYDRLKTFHPDCVFLDLMLPGVSGLDILKELRSNPDHGCTTTKIIILTNLAQSSIADGAIIAGADGYVIKADILPKDLPDVIKSLDD